MGHVGLTPSVHLSSADSVAVLLCPSTTQIAALMPVLGGQLCSASPLRWLPLFSREVCLVPSLLAFCEMARLSFLKKAFDFMRGVQFTHPFSARICAMGLCPLLLLFCVFLSPICSGGLEEPQTDLGGM